MQQLLLSGLPVVILLVVIWGVSTALKPRDNGISEAERYQRDLAARSQAHYAAQIRQAMELRARIAATTAPSQNQQSDLNSAQRNRQ
ncbi:hypothetical protein ACQR35_13755 [Pseudarthrobacter sp. J1738]|uniref:hypothetical protein n=1 Tax=Pseudarthrobacter sp. J1763 TaxID=3420445 RepID=UPI003D2D20A7